MLNFVALLENHFMSSDNMIKQMLFKVPYHDHIQFWRIRSENKKDFNITDSHRIDFGDLVDSYYTCIILTNIHSSF